jgi:hypothetical protein
MKPHLSKFLGTAWLCEGWGYVAYGRTPYQAYHEWVCRLPPHKARMVRSGGRP